MASFKAFAPFFLMIFLFAACKHPAPAKSGASVLPQMSRQEGDVIKQREISFWEYSKTKQFDKLREIMADDYIGYFSSGNMRPVDVINLLRSTSFNSYHLSNINVRPVSENTAIVYYDVSQDVVSADGEKWIPEVMASSVYTKRNGVWYSVFYQEMPAR